MDDDQEPCGAVFEIDAVDIVSGDGQVRRKTPTVELVCSRPWGHTPRNRHSDGVNDWIGDEE